ncbi:MAG: DUF3237 domain-containing protein [Pseudomonadales bacterium]
MSFIKFMVLLAMLPASFTAIAQAPEPGLESEYLMDIVLETAAPQQAGTRLIVPITGGSFEGPGIKGKILDVGADWISTRPDGVNDLDVRITLETDDHALIYMTYAGILDRTGAGAYWRMVPTFETGAEKYQYLTKIIAVGVGKRMDGKTAYRIYRIL